MRWHRGALTVRLPESHVGTGATSRTTSGVASYTAARATWALGAVGMLFNIAASADDAVWWPTMLIALGLYLTGFTRFLTPIEQLGRTGCGRAFNLSRAFPMARSVSRLPERDAVGLPSVRSRFTGVLATALVTGSASRGAMLMLAFGLGTLPNLPFGRDVAQAVCVITHTNRSSDAVPGIVVLSVSASSGSSMRRRSEQTSGTVSSAASEAGVFSALSSGVRSARVNCPAHHFRQACAGSGRAQVTPILLTTSNQPFSASRISWS